MHFASLAVILLSGSFALAYEPCRAPTKPNCCTVTTNALNKLIETGCDPVTTTLDDQDHFIDTCGEKVSRCCPLRVGGITLVCQDLVEDDDDFGFGLFDV
ncbi:hypothetical protein F5X68DRAFT_236094 [Plectosphaerella plurivora]|uniref:Hydrophobin n=1 Tax=Plectosphaerella plurivora TaxID=936078 RepID=A0A9P8V360_9PEZI|nr:hypothetical protein F5X68DRAFT_236094 [Plectosphaerella plurivora]